MLNTLLTANSDLTANGARWYRSNYYVLYNLMKSVLFIC